MPAANLDRERDKNRALGWALFNAQNAAIEEDRKLRLQNREDMEKMIAEDRLAFLKWQKWQQEQADEGGWLAGAFTGGGTGASIGSFWGPPGAAIGGIIGAVGGAIYGGMEGKQAVQEIAPYAGAVSRIAGSISGAQAQKERTQKLIDFYNRQGTSPGQADPLAAERFDPRRTFIQEEGQWVGEIPSLSEDSYRVSPQGATSQLQMLDRRRQNPLSTDYAPVVTAAG